MSKFTKFPKFRTLPVSPGRLRREAKLAKSESSDTSINTRDEVGSRLENLDLHLMSNCSIDRAELLVSNCIESETEDFAESHPILDQGCTASNDTLEIVTTESTSKIYRLDLSNVQTQGSTMYIRCTVNLCISTLPSQECPDLCTRSLNQRSVVSSLFTKSYTISSGPVSLVITTPAPKATVTPTPATTVAQTTDRAPEQASATAAGVILATISILLQNVFLH